MSFTYGETEEERRARHLDRVLTGRVEQKEMHLFALHGPLIARWKGYARSCRRDSCAESRQVPGGLPINGLRITASVGVATGHLPG